MRRKDDRVLLRPGNAPPKKKSILNFNRSDRSRRNARRRRNPVNPSYENRYGGRKEPKTHSKTTVLLLILALVAFIIGAGAGVSLSLDDGQSHEPHYQNVTVEMTKNVTNHTNNTNPVIYDQDVDNVDYNNPQSLSGNQSSADNYDEYYDEGYSDDYEYSEDYSEY